jgi:4,5-DOPA dioxygenase extradiol
MLAARRRGKAGPNVTSGSRAAQPAIADANVGVMSRLPTLFLSHGSPLHAIDPGGAGRAWRAIADSLPRPRAVLMISAHWETSRLTLTSRGKHDTIHDFGGFPAELYRLRYDAPGSPGLASEAASLLRDAGHEPALDPDRGLDHGAWVPLRWMYPDTDVPVVQLSVQTTLGARHHLAVGESLRPLADDDVLVIGSGHVTHNLRDWALHRRDPQPMAYALHFAEWLRSMLESNDREALVAWRSLAPDAVRAHPTEEHFLPLFVALGAAGRVIKSERVYSAVEGAALSMDAYSFI